MKQEATERLSDEATEGMWRDEPGVYAFEARNPDETLIVGFFKVGPECDGLMVIAYGTCPWAAAQDAVRFVLGGECLCYSCFVRGDEVVPSRLRLVGG